MPGQMCSYVAGYEVMCEVVDFITRAETARGLTVAQATIRAHNFIMRVGETPLHALHQASRVMFGTRA